MNAMDIYNLLSKPPIEALKRIEGGKLTGKTDINPQWRYRAMTEQFGLCGNGWAFTIEKLWTESGANGEIIAMAHVNVRIKEKESWGEPIPGIGGSKLVQLEKNLPITNDEGYKMAVTDALGTALKMVGVAASIYAGEFDGSKYTNNNPYEKKADPVSNVKTVFGMKGGASTPKEVAEIKQLLATVAGHGVPLFSEARKREFSAMRTSKTASEVIALIKDEVQRLIGQPDIF